MSIKERYEKLATERKDYEDRAESNSELTIPAIFTDEAFTGKDSLVDKEVQSLGGMGVKALASKLVMSLMPPEGRFFRIRPHSGAMNELTGGDSNAKAQAISIMSQGEEDVLAEITKQDIQTKFFTLMQYLAISGNMLIEKLPKDGLRLHSLRNYVVKRNSRGKPIEIIFVEKVVNSDLVDFGIELAEDEEAELYTRVYLEEKDRWIQEQEVNGDIVGDEKTFSSKKLPYNPAVWELLPNESYGRAYVDDLRPDLMQYQNCIKMLVEGSIAASKTVYMVNPLGQTKKKDLAEAANLDIIDGREEDVTTPKTNKNYDFQQISQLIQDYRMSLGKAFLDTGSARRDAERVTAEEIQMMIRELETVLAGTFTHFATNLLEPIVQWIIDEVGIEVGDGTDINIVVGADALAKSRETEKTLQFVNILHSLKYNDYVNEGEVVTRLANSIGINQVNLVLTPAQVKEKRVASAQALQAQQAGMAGMASAGQNIMNPQQQGGQ